MFLKELLLMFYVPNCCSLYLGLLKYFTGTLRGNHLLFVSKQMHSIMIHCAWNIWLSCVLEGFFFLLK